MFGFCYVHDPKTQSNIEQKEHAQNRVLCLKSLGTAV